MPRRGDGVGAPFWHQRRARAPKRCRIAPTAWARAWRVRFCGLPDTPLRTGPRRPPAHSARRISAPPKVGFDLSRISVPPDSACRGPPPVSPRNSGRWNNSRTWTTGRHSRSSAATYRHCRGSNESDTRCLQPGAPTRGFRFSRCSSRGRCNSSASIAGTVPASDSRRGNAAVAQSQAVSFKGPRQSLLSSAQVQTQLGKPR